MNIIKLKSEDINLHPKINTINLIDSKSGIIHLPDSLDLCFVELLFQRKGKFVIKSKTHMVIGNEKSKSVFIDPGIPGYDTNPMFIYDPDFKEWFIRSVSNFVIYDLEDNGLGMADIYKTYKENQ